MRGQIYGIGYYVNLLQAETNYLKLVNATDYS